MWRTEVAYLAGSLLPVVSLKHVRTISRYNCVMILTTWRRATPGYGAGAATAEAAIVAMMMDVSNFMLANEYLRRSKI
jgi:hypothetical protein